MVHLIQHHLALLHASSRGNDRIGSSDLLDSPIQYKGCSRGPYRKWGLSSVLVINKHLSHHLVVEFHAVCRCTICGAQVDSEARIPGITMTVRVDIFTKSVTSNPQTNQPKFPNQLCDSHPDLIEHTTNVHLIPPLKINTDTRNQTRSTEIQTNPFPPPSLTHPLLPRKHTPHLTPETPPLSVP